jgi:hypothetical protein
MSLLSMFWEAFQRDPPEILPESEIVKEAAQISELKAQRDRADCYELELMRLKYPRARLHQMVDAYRKDILREVRRAS